MKFDQIRAFYLIFTLCIILIPLKLGSREGRRRLPTAVREVDLLLKDLSEKKQSFRQNVVLLAAELKEVGGRLAAQERCFAKETLTRQYVKELDDLRSQILATKATADASSLCAQSAQMRCSALVKELEEKICSLKEHEIWVDNLGEQLNHLQKDVLAREFSKSQLKNELLRIEHEIMQALPKSRSNDSELRKILDELSPRNFDHINKFLTVKDEEIAKLRDEIKIMSAHWKLKTNELESQLEKHHRADQDLKKRVLKLEFCLQEARAQTCKLQRMGELRNEALKELRDKLAAKQLGVSLSSEKQNFWQTSGFKIVVSMSMLILVMLSKR